jgi:hypothetical protein
MNMATLVRSPYFRSYWIQRNVSDLKEYTAGIADLRRRAGELREDRVLVRAEPAEPRPDPAAVAQLLRLAPPEAGLYRAWAAPSSDQAAAMVEQKLLAPHAGGGLPSRSAPAAAFTDGTAGSEADLEIRIDEPPPASVAPSLAPEPLRKLLAAAKLEGALELQRSRPMPDGVFVGTESVLVFQAGGDWDANAVRSAMASAVEGLFTTSQLGLKWAAKTAGGQTFEAVDGPARLAVASRGRLLMLGDSEELMAAVLSRVSAAPATESGHYAAGFRHSAERDPYERMMRLMDYPQRGEGAAPDPQQPREPLFFSENVASLSRTLARVESETIVVRDSGPVVAQTVVYRIGR